MRSVVRLRLLFVCAGAAALGGCLVSEEPMLDASNGNATPIAPGDYVMCPLGEEADEADCNIFAVAYDDTGLYSFTDPEGEEDTGVMRFRQVGRGGYAVQSDEDDSYMYYYGSGDSERFLLTLMMCDQLPEDLRSRLIEDGDLSADDDEFVTCTVNTLKGLTDPAKAYHRGDIGDGDRLDMEFTPAPATSSVSE